MDGQPGGHRGPGSWEQRAIRRQLSLFVPPSESAELESVRRLLDPAQSRLIPAHVTLCREDELARVSESDLCHRLSRADLAPVTLRFGRPVEFSGHGVMLECVGGGRAFDSLRGHLLGPGGAVRRHAHITLAHPRNPRAPGNSMASAMRLPAALSFTFPTVSLIEQDGDQPWMLLEAFELPG